MTVREIQGLLESWAPAELAWERDNVGLQVGTLDRNVKRLLVTLDVTREVVQEARRKRVDLIISHHPLLFHPLKSVRLDDRVGEIITLLVRSDIALYSAHTNLDFTSGGVSTVLAEHLGLENVRILQTDRKMYKKVSVFVPPDHLDPVLSSMADAGAGTVGKYDECSFGTAGTGTFRPLPGANPYTGKVGKREMTTEVKLEMITPSWRLSDVVTAMHRAHPYEEVAYDVYDLANASREVGAGAIGELSKGMAPREFLRMVSLALRVPVLRCSGSPRRSIKRVAVCGGSGSDLLQEAIRQEADALITADISYHRFEETHDRVFLIDAGHYETEALIVASIVRYLRNATDNQRIPLQISGSSAMKNHVHYFLS